MERRTLLLSALAAGTAYTGYRFVPSYFSEGFDFEPLGNPKGFRRITGGNSSSGSFNPFVGLEADDEDRNTLDTAVSRANVDPCRALYGPNGASSNKVQIASFSDYYCPFCRVQTQKLAAIEEADGSGVRISWHELPLLGEGSNLAAKAALAAKRQGAYVAFHKRLMRSPFQATTEYLIALSENIGVNGDQLIADMGSPEVQQELQNSAALAQIFGFVGTPALVIGRTVVQGQMSARRMKQLIERERLDGSLISCGVA
jgi:protein-disulfide isomerase